MRRALLLSTLLFSFSAILAAQSLHSDSKTVSKQPMAAGSASPAAVQTARASFVKLPLSFEENRGQTDARVKYLSRAANYNLFLTADEAVLTLQSGSVKPGCGNLGVRKNIDCMKGGAPDTGKGGPEDSVLWLKMLGANPSAQVTGSELLPGKINYYFGNDPSKWRTGVRQFGRVTYRDIYPGVDLTYYGNQRQLESDYLVAPGANPRAIEFEVRGASGSRIDTKGNLILSTSAGNVQLLRPVAYQMIKGVRHDVSGRYVLRGSNHVGFEIANYDRRNALVIDPVLVYSTFLGGSTLSTSDMGNAIAIDSTGAAYVTGQGGSSDFPGAALNGPVGQSTPVVFVTKFDPTGNTLVYSTLLRGSTGYTNSGNGIGVDSSGNAYVGGVTTDSDFPLVNPFQATAGNGVADDENTGFVAGLATDGTLMYSTYFGGRNENDITTIQGVFADTVGNTYVVGNTSSYNFPTVNPLYSTFGGQSEGYTNVFVAKFNGQGQPIYSTYLPGNGNDVGNAIVADASGNAYITGQTSSTNFPLQTSPAPFQSTLNGSADVFVTKLSFNTSSQTLALASSTLLGGSTTQEGWGIAIDTASPPNVYVTGQTDSSGSGTNGFPTQSPLSGTFGGVPYSGATNGGGSDDAFVTKIKGDFTALIYSSYLGGSATDIGYGIALDGANPPNAYVTGSTNSANFPLANPLQLNAYPNTSHAFVTEVNGSGSALTYSTFLEGVGTDQGRGIAADSTGNAYITGSTTSPNFPVLSSSGVSASPFQSSLGSSTGNAIVAKISPAAAPSSLNFVPPVYNFHNVGVGPGINNTGGFATEYFTLSNNTASSITLGSPNPFNLTGPNNGDFAVQSTGTTCTSGFVLAAGASCLVLVRFTPMDQDLRTAQLTINSTPTSSTVLNLSGFGAVPGISLSTNSINFGTNAPLNTGALSSVEITNTGGATLNVGSVQITGANASAFTLTFNTCTSVAPNSSCFVEVTFTPTAAQAYSANLLINDNAAGSPQTVSLSGTGVAQVVVSPTSHEYGGWIIGTASPDQDFFLNNGSGGSITLTNITPGGGTTQSDFTNDTNSTTCTNGLVLPAGTGCNLEVYFKPGASGPTDTVDGRTGTFTFNWTGTLTGSQQVTVMGAAETGVTLYVNSVTATNEYVGVTESTAGGDIIYNGTTNPISVTSVTLSGANPQDWTVQLGSSPTGNDCSADGIVPANSYCYLSGSFTPSAVGVRTATATINYTGTGVPANSSLTLSLTGTGIPGPVSFQSLLPFGSQIVSLTSPTHRVLLENTQKTPLAISSVSAPSGANGTDFAILSTSTCASSITVPGGGICYLDLDFTPGATGSRTATVTITDNGPGSPRTLTLTGTGVTGSDQISVNPTVVDFGNVPLVGAGLTQPTLTGGFFLTNGGNSNTTITTSTASPNPALMTTPSPFALITGTGSSCAPTPTATPIVTTVLPQGGTCSVEVTFKPTTTGEVSNTVTLTDSLGGQHMVTIQGNGVDQGVISLTGMAITQLPGTTSTPQAITVNNTGSGPLTITSLAFTEGNGSNFALVSTGTTCTIGSVIPPGGSCIVNVTFTAPNATGSTSANLRVNANLGNGVSGSTSASITGTVVSGGFTVAPTPPLNFGTVALGTTIDYSQVFNGYGSISITNNNPGPVTITKVAPQTGTDFAVTSNSCLTTLAANNACYFDVTFTPSTSAAETNNIQVTYTGANSASSPFNIAVKGTGSSAVVATPNPLSASTTIGGGSSPTITIGNGSTSTVTITGTSAITPANSPFSLSFNTCSTLTATGTPGNYCQIYINFNPTIPGPYAASFNVNYTVGANPTVQSLQVNLNGTGTAPVAMVTPNPVVFPGQNVNTQSQVINVVVQNTGNDYMSFTNLPTITGPNANDFALAVGNYNTNCQYAYLQPGQSCVIPLNFTPSQLTSGSSRSATLTITDNSYPNKTQTVTLEGTASAGSVFTETTNLTFPQTNVGSTLTEGVLLSNTTNAAVVFNGVTFTPTVNPTYSSDTGTNTCVTGKSISAFTGTCVVYIKFSPTGVTNPGTATVHYGASGTIIINLTGAGSNPTVYASPSPLTFTSTRINTSSAQGTVSLTNGTASAATVTSTVTTAASISGTNASDFSVVGSGTTCTSGFTLTALGGSCNVIVTFSPAPGALGTRTATLTILASDANSPHIVTLSGTAIAPNAQVPATLAFGNQATSQTSTMSLTVSNNGTDTLHLASSAAFAITSGADSSFFGIGTSAQGTTCSNGLAIGASSSCTIIVTFSPTTVRSYGPVTLTVTDDSGAIVGSTQQVSVTGAGVAASVNFSQSPVNFTPSQDVGTTSSNLTLTLTNSGGLALQLAASNAVSIGAPGNAASDFSIVSTGTTCVNGFTVPPSGGSCNIVLTFTPGAAGARSATLTVTDNANPTTQTVTLNGTGIAPTASLNPTTTLGFGNQIVSVASTQQTVTLTNSGTDVLKLATVAIDPASTNASDFAIVSGAGTTCTAGATIGFTAPNNTCTVALTFTPGAAGSRGPATLKFTDNSGEVTGTVQSITLTGTGQAPPTATLSTNSVPFGNQRLGTTSTATVVTITNNGDATLAIAGIALDVSGNPGDYVLTAGATNPCPLSGGNVLGHASCTINVAFKPTATGSRTGTVDITDNGNATGTAGTKQTVGLTGTGVAPIVQVAASLPFGNQPTNLTSTMPLTVSNTGTDTLNLAASSAFAITSGADASFFGIGTGAQGTTCSNGLAISAGSSCTIIVTFSPTTVRSYGPVTLTLTDDTGAVTGSTQLVSITGAGVAASVGLNPNPVTFTPSQDVGTTSSNLTVTLTNTGGLDLHLAATKAVSIVAPGNAVSDFAIVPTGTTCVNGATVPKTSGSCTIILTFTPGATGARSATLSIADDATPSPQTVTLNGTGIAPTASLNPTTTLGFGNQIVNVASTQQTVALTNSGTDVLKLATVAIDPASTNASDFAIVSGAATTCTAGATIGFTAPNNTCTVALTFTPGAAGSRGPATLKFTDNSGEVTGTVQSITLTGTGQAPPTATLSTNSVPFGNQRLGTTSTATVVTISNNGDATLAIAGIALDVSGNPGDYVLTAGATNPCPLSGGNVLGHASCTINVAFKPTATGARAATVDITDNGNATGTAGTKQTVSLSGNGTAPSVQVASSVPFGNQPINQTASMPLTVTNNGTDTLNLGATALAITTGTDPTFFGIGSGTTCTNSLAIPPNGSCTINVTFTPTTVRSYGPATLVITDDAGTIVGSTQQVSLTGSGVTAVVNFNQSPVNFTTSQDVGTTSSNLTVTLTNSGGLAVQLAASNAVAIGTPGNATSDFAIVPAGTTCVNGFALTALGGSCNIVLTFTPGATGARSATLTVTDNANPTTQTVTLNGTGIAPVASLNPTTTLGFGNQIVNVASAQQTVALTNSGTDVLKLATVAIDPASTNASDFAIVSGAATTCTAGATIGFTAPNNTCTVALTFTPGAAGSRGPATLKFTDNSGEVTGTVQSITLTGTGQAPPTATLSTNSVPFGNQRLGTTSTATVVTISNNGDATLAIAGIALDVSGNPGDYVLTAGATNPCPLSGGNVSGHASCTINVAFKPTATGARAATVDITDNGNATGTAGTKQTVGLTGTGTAPAASVPATFSFNNRSINQTATLPLTVSNTGTDTLNLAASNAFAITPAGSAFGIGTGAGACTNGQAIPAGGSCTIYVTFAPTAVQTYTATLTVTDDSGAVTGTTQTSALSGTGVTSTAVLNPNPLVFATSQRVNSTSAPLTMTVTNVGTAALDFASIGAVSGANPGDFASATAAAPVCTVGTPVAANASCNLAFTFKPTATGSRTAQVVFTDDANGVSGSTQTLTLNGTGIAPTATVTTTPASSPLAIAFANQIVLTTSTTSGDVNINNSGTDTLNVASILLGGANPTQYKLVAPGDGVSPCSLSAGFTLAAGASCNFGVQFAPTATGSQPATVVITDDTGAVTGSTQTIALTGTSVTPPTDTLSTNSVNFNMQRVATTSAAQSLTITNTGGAPLNISGITITGTNLADFAFGPATTCPVAAGGGQIAPNSSCTLSITFDPGATGPRSASINITVTGIANPAPVSLSGTGIAPVVALVPATLPAFANTEINTSSAAQSGVLNNTGTDNLHITNVAITGTNPSDFSIVAAGTSCATGLPTAVVVAASGSCTWSVKFTPTALGARSASLTFTDDNNAVAGSTQSIALTGTGTAPTATPSPTTVSFPAQALNTTSSPMGGTLTNSGNNALHLAATGAVTIGVPGNALGDFAIAPAGTTCGNNVTVAQTNGTCTWSVTFTPTANGTRTATLIFTDDSSGTPGTTQIVSLTGVTPAAATLSPSTPIAFSAQGVGTASSASTITLTNPGGSTLHITTVAPPTGTNAGDFAIATGSTCTNGSTVAPSATCTVNVTFTPGAAGARGPATIVITDDAGGVLGTTQSISLSGTGISYALNVQTAPPPTAAGQPIMATIQLTPGTGGFPNTITFSATGLPPDSTGMFNPATLTPPITGPITSVFTLTTMARSGSVPRQNHPLGPLSGGWIATAILSLLAMLTLRRGFRLQRFAYLPLAVLLLSAAIITGCATASGTPAGSYTVTITATSGSYSQTTTVPVTVQ